jgi:hypothetical protein
MSGLHQADAAEQAPRRATGERRRIATRYDKLAANCLALVRLASIGLWLRVNESTSEKRPRYLNLKFLVPLLMR